jgi:hypothetical protein
MGRPLASISYNPTSLNSLRYLENHVLTLPNKIHNLKVSASHLAARKLKTYLRNTYGSAGRGMTVRISENAGYLRLNISATRFKAPPSGKIKGTEKDNAAANILLFGRRAFVGKRNQDQGPYRLRDDGDNKYPQFLWRIRVKKMNRNYAARRDIERTASTFLRDAIYSRALASGFGVRGGNPSGMKDTPYVSDRSAPSERVGW